MMLCIIRSIEGWTAVARNQQSSLGGGLVDCPAMARKPLRRLCA